MRNRSVYRVFWISYIVVMRIAHSVYGTLYVLDNHNSLIFTTDAAIYPPHGILSDALELE